MADDRGSRSSKGRGKGGDGGSRIVIQGQVCGVRNNCTLRIKLMKGRQSLTKERLAFRYGTPDRPLGNWLPDPTDADKRLVKETDKDGEVELGPFDFSDKEAFPPDQVSQIMVYYDRLNPPGEGEYTQAFPLPGLDSVDPSKAIKKAKRLKIGPEEEVIRKTYNKYSLQISTFDKSGKNPDSGSVLVKADGPITVKDEATDNILTTDVKMFTLTTPSTDNAAGNQLKGTSWVQISFAGPKRKVVFIHSETREEVTKELQIK